jgi:TonB-linked SusC/RagA family outer membrane protein
MKKTRFISKFILLSLFLSVVTIPVTAQKVTLSYKNVPFEKVLNSIKQQTGLSLVFSEQLVDVNRKVSISVNSVEIQDVLKQLLVGTNVDFEIKNNKLYLIEKKAKEKSDLNTIRLKNVSGFVTDANGDPIIGASVVEVGTKNGTVTDINGKFNLTKTYSDFFKVSYIGYISTEVQLNGKTDVYVKLQEDAKNLNEVVVVGFATQKKVNLTGAVGTVDMKSLDSRPVKSATQMLQGIVPGLNIAQSAGGGVDNTPTINIRGIATIGQGSTGAPLILIDGMEGDINAINPQDIGSVSVLKDVSASSIYGSRAAFGVILVTTKEGSEGQVVQYNNNFKANSPITIPKMVDSYRFALYFNDGLINSGSSAKFSDEWLQRIQDYQSGKITTNNIPNPSNPTIWMSPYNGANDNVDWYKALYKDYSLSQEHNLSISGGTKKMKYYGAVNYLNENGLMKLNSDYYNRYTATIKLSKELNSWANINLSSRYIREDRKKPYYLTNTFFYDLARQGWPILPLYDSNGYMYSSPSPALDLTDGGNTNSQTDYLYNQCQLVIQPIKNWKTFFEFNYRLKDIFTHSDVQMTYNHDVSGNPYVSNANSSVYEYAYRDNYFNMNIYSEYARDFGGHNFKVMIGYQNELDKYRNFSANRIGIISPDLPVLNLTSGVDNSGKTVAPTVGGEYQNWATAGLFGRLNYNYKNRYLLETNLRYDGTSRFQRDQRWNWFPSVSAGWNLAQEDFFKSLSTIVDVLKIRGSFGELGNQNTTNLYPTYQVMPISTGTGSWLLNSARTNLSSAPSLISSRLTWERVRNWNVGFDLNLFNNRLTATFDYFKRFTLDMVGPAPELPVTLGTAVPVTNNTNLVTYGFESSVSWRDKIGKDFGYNVRFNLFDSQTRITSYPNPTGLLSTYRTGQMLGEIWGYETVGIAKSQQEMDNHLATLPNGGQNSLGTKWEAGDIMYKDLNGDGKISAGASTIGDHGDLKVIGNSAPRYSFTFELGMNWKGFDISSLFQGVMKKDYFSGDYYFWGMGSKGIWYSTAFEEHMNYFRADENSRLGQNLDSYYPRPLAVGASKNQQVQTRYLQDASYIRLKNLQIGYTIPSSITKKVKINSLRIYLSGENLWTGTKCTKIFDPETIDGRSDGAVVYPLNKVISAGLSLKL